MNRRLTSNTLLSLGLLALASPALAEAAAGSTPPSPGDAAGQIAEVVVTATRRAAPLQSVPISVGVVSADDYKLSNLKGVRDLQYLSPSVYVTTANGASIAIRGVGTTSTNNGGEQAVGLVVDGVVIGFIDDLALDSLPDLDHVEVLRGPQGELFGKNASAGVISITTKSPTFGAFYGTAHGSYGELNDTNDNITLNIPINDTLAARFTAYFVSRDGFVKDVALNRTVGGANSGGFQSKLLWKPNDKFDLLLNGDFRNALQEYNFLATWENFGHGYKTYAPGGLGQQALGIVAGPDNIENADFESGHRLTRSGGLSAQANYHFSNGITLTSVTAERLLGRDVNAAIVSGAIPFENQHLTYNGQQFSQELRVTSPGTDRITYVGGLFFYNRTADATSLVAGPFGGQAAAVYGPGTSISNVGGRQDVHNVVESTAAFGEAAYHVTHALKLVAGGRFTYDDTHASTHTDVLPGLFPPPGGIVRPSGSGSSNTTNFSYRVGPQYNITPGIMVYFTYSTGYKGPVIDTDSSNAVRLVQAETVKSYEGGVKSTLLDHHLILDLSIFDEKFNNFQTSVFSPVLNGFILGNAGGLESKGAELNFTAKPIKGLTLTGGVNYLEAVYTDFKASCYSTLAPIPQALTSNPSGVGGCYIAPGASSGSGFIQAAGFPLANASKWVYNLGLQYERSVAPGLRVDGSVTYSWRSKFFNVGYDPNTRINAYGLLGMNVGVGPDSGAWRLGVFARNLLDTYFVASVASTSLDAGAYTNLISPEARRTVGVSLDVAF